MTAIDEAREHLKQCNGCEKELTPATIGDLVLGFNNLLFTAQRDSYRAGRMDEKQREPGTEQRERQSEQAQVNLDHRRELSEDPPQRVPIIGPVKS